MIYCPPWSRVGRSSLAIAALGGVFVLLFLVDQYRW